MSYCQTVPFGGGEPHEFRNAHGGAAFVWDHVQRHLGWDSDAFRASGYADRAVAPWMGRSEDSIAPLWALHANSAVPDFERIALAWTFDLVWTPAEHVPRVAEALRQFERVHLPGPRVCHLAAIADAMEEAVAAGAWGIGMYQMSVSENPWIEWDEDADGYREVEPTDDGAIHRILPDLFTPTDETEATDDE